MTDCGSGVEERTYDPSTQGQEDQEFKVCLPHMKPYLKRAEEKTITKEKMGAGEVVLLPCGSEFRPQHP